MKIEKLRKNHKNKIIVGGVITLGVLGTITILPSFAKYKLTESINVANGTVNYKVPDLKIMAMYTSEDSTNYTETLTMPRQDYIINEEKTYCTTDNVNQVKGKIKTENGKVTVQSLTKGDKCYLYFDAQKQPRNIEELIAFSNPTTQTSTLPNFLQSATTNEGVFKTNDGMYGGDSYYWRGAVDNNYVSFARYCWRIIHINGDGTIRLIYDGASCHVNGTNTTESIAITNQVYNSSYKNSVYVGWTYNTNEQRTLSGTPSNAKTQLESWYSNKLASYEDKIADGKYCNDRDVESGATWSAGSSSFNYAAKNRINNGAPTLNCPNGDAYTLKVGLITADEVIMAGGQSASNNLYYLYNGQIYWTMSPNSWYTGMGDGCVMAVINKTGHLSNQGANISAGIRPVINLRSDITFSDGDGTLNNPYIVQ